MSYEISNKEISESRILEQFLPIVRNILILVTANSFPPLLPVSGY